MINIEEISIGNYLNYNNEPIIVHFIPMIEGVYNIAYLKNKFDSSYGGALSYNSFEPIILDERWLIRLGAIKNDYDEYVPLS